jgi:hypothetical protein
VIRRALTFAVVLLPFVGGCQKDVFLPPESTYHLAIKSGDVQSAPAGSILPQPLVVTVLDADGDPVKGVRVAFAVLGGGSVMLDTINVTAPDGTATGRLQLGSTLDTTVVNVHPVLASNRSVTMKAVATAGPVLTSASKTAVAAGDTVTLRGKGFAALQSPNILFGTATASVLGAVSDSVVQVVVPACLAAGATDVRVGAGSIRTNAISMTYGSRTAPLTLQQYQAVTITSDQISGCLTLAGGGIQYLMVLEYASVGSPDSAIDWSFGTSYAQTTSAVSALSPPAAAPQGTNLQFDQFLRQTERQLAPLARAEASVRGSDLSFATVIPQPPALGSLRAFKVVAATDGSRFSDVGARVKYIGDHLLMYVDTVGQGFSDPDYAALGKQFDTDLYPVDVNAFGSESDIDGNGRIIVLFTPVVNSLVPKDQCGSNGYVAGFFYGNDLVTQAPNSNKGEIFYALIPDSSGTYSCQHTALAVKSLLPDTYIHEFQHMISFNQHVLARGGNVEETWLNEGMSHIAEELGSKLYEARYPAPLDRSTTTQLFPDSSSAFISPQLLNAYTYLYSIRGESVTSYDGGGTVQDRGATWLFLRWLADQKGESVLRALEQTSKTGIANIEAQSGESFGALFGDFGITIFTDSIIGKPRSAVPPRYRFLSRDLHQLMARASTLYSFGPLFPLSLFSLPAPSVLQTDMIPGTMSHVLIQSSFIPPVSPFLSLKFTRKDGSAFDPALGAQVSIMRLSP